MSDNIISLQEVSVVFDDSTILNKISLDIKDGEFITLLGPSGCGKTTTLRILGGFVEPSQGRVYFDGQSMIGVPPHKRQVSTIFQRYALFPHLNVYENIAFGLRVRKVPEAELCQRVEEVINLVNLRGFEKRKISALSGGQQQRVAIARAVVTRPKVLLLDEPLAALDLKLRKDMQVELKNIQQSLGITFVFVTHDQEEALSMSDRVVVMDEGKIQQIGTPQDIYNEPENAFVADFIGESNILDGVMVKDGLCRFAGKEFVCVDGGFGNEKPVDVVIRPEDIKVTAPDEGMLSGLVTGSTFKGVHYEVIVDIEGFKWMIQTTACIKEGDHIGMVIGPEDIHIMEKSQYSGMFGDYSSFSDEMDYINNPNIDLSEEEPLEGGEDRVD
ncbi:MAG: ABC transporter ATP-binding protein [Clostridia bacterium]|nr:ABC transporter ATP-binding protein [Clostridia bacterium]